MILILLMLGAALVGGMCSLVLLGLWQEFWHQRAIVRDEEELIARLPKLPETWGPK